MKKVVLLTGALSLTPFVAFAQVAAPNLGFFTQFLNAIQNLVNLAVPLVIGIAVLLFLWGLATYILNQDDEEKRKGARSLMIWGVIIIFVMVALWGLVNLLTQLTGIQQGGVGTAPGVPA